MHRRCIWNDADEMPPRGCAHASKMHIGMAQPTCRRTKVRGHYQHVCEGAVPVVASMHRRCIWNGTT